jgi:hypothetical protein
MKAHSGKRLNRKVTVWRGGPTGKPHKTRMTLRELRRQLKRWQGAK